MYAKFCFSNKKELKLYSHGAELSFLKFQGNYIIQKPWYSEEWLDLITILAICYFLAQSKRNYITETILDSVVNQ